MIPIILLLLHQKKNPHSASVTLKGWKHHTCMRCGGRFRYVVETKKIWRGPTRQAAHESAEQIARKTLERQVEPRPCPTCGLYQPSMLYRNRLHIMVLCSMLFTVLPLIGLRFMIYADNELDLIYMWLATMPGLLAILTSWAPALFIGLGILAHIWIDVTHPNRYLQSNLDTAKALQNLGQVELTKPGDELVAQDNAAPATGLTAGSIGIYGALVVAILAALAGEALLLIKGWPTNPECKTLVAGPGDNIQVLLPTKITSVKGYWHAVGQAEIMNAADLGVKPELPLISKEDRWGDRIDTENAKVDNPINLWGKVQLPDDPKLAGQKVQIKIDLQVVYPKEQFHGFQNTQLSATHTATLVLAKDSHAGATFFYYYWIGGIIAMVLTLLANIAVPARSESMRSKGLPTEFHLIEDQPPATGAGEITT